MWFLALKLLKLGYKSHKKHKANKAQHQHQQPDPGDAAKFPHDNPQYTHGFTDINLNENPKALVTTTAEEMYGFHANTVRNPFKTALDILLRLLQFALGIAVIGLYSGDLHSQLHPNDDKKGKMDPRWLYAVITASLASLTALSYLIAMFVLRKRTPPARRVAWLLPGFFWEGVLWLLWLVVFGIFGKVYIPCTGVEGHRGHEKMWRAVWVVLVCWGVSWGLFGWCGLRWWRGGGCEIVGGARAGAGQGDAEKGQGQGQGQGESQS